MQPITSHHVPPRSRALRALGVWALFLGLWGIANWPGLREAWWFYDDYGKKPDSWWLFSRGMQNGRPVEGILFQSFLWDRLPENPAANIICRLVQGATHAAAAAIATCWLARSVRLGVAVIAMLPFLLWPFAAEATLWCSTVAYPVGALLGILSIVVASTSRRWSSQATAFLLGALATTTNPCSAMAGPVLVLIHWLSVVTRGSALELRNRVIDVIAPIAGLFVGCLVGWWIVNHTSFGTSRGGLVFDPVGKLQFLHRLDSELLWSDHFPTWLRIPHRGLVIAGLFASILGSRVLEPRWWRRIPVIVALWSMLLLSRYAPIMVTAESWGSWRVMYVGPLILTAAWVAIGARWRVGWPAWISKSAMAILLAAYLPISWENSGEYLRLYQGDMRIVRELREFCEREDVESVCLLTLRQYPPRVWNPYKFRYMHGESKASAWMHHWFEKVLVEELAGLRLESDPLIKAEAAALWAAQPIGGFRIMMLPGRRVAFVCPP